MTVSVYYSPLNQTEIGLNFKDLLRVVAHTQNNRVIISILKGEEFKDKTIIIPYCTFWDKDGDLAINEPICYYVDETRFATEEEKQNLFDAIKENGYKWNAETKTLEKLIVPKFKVGDRIRLKSKPNYVYNIHSLTWAENNHLAYRLLPDNDKHLMVVGLHKQEDYELVPNKFDISTLKPFDKVLVRNTNTEYWRISLFGAIANDDKRYFMCVANSGFYQCIPYNEDTKHLVGTNDDCDDFYKTW